jgi:sugar lactone lactonase YvrE
MASSTRPADIAVLEDIPATTTLFAEGFGVLENPCWHDDALWLSDTLAKRVYRISMDGAARMVAQVPHRPSGLGFLPDGRLLVIAMHDRRLLRRQSGEFICHADLSRLVAGELSEMVVDDQGRAYVGVLDRDGGIGKISGSSCMILVGPDGGARIVAKDLAFPNSFAFSKSPRRLIVAETFRQRLAAFDIAADGTLHNPRLFASLIDINPAGICLDQEGGVWLASANQPWFVRVLEGGDVTHRIYLPRRRAIACQLGGSHGRTLFCITTGKDSEDTKSHSLTARINIVTVDIPAQGHLDA